MAVSEVDLGYENTFPFHWAAIRGDLGVVQQYLDRGFDPNMPDEFRDTPMHGAVLNKHEHVVRLLFKRGANLFIRNMYKKRPIDVAADNNDAAMLKVLSELRSTPQGKKQESEAGGPSNQRDELGRRKVYELSAVTEAHVDPTVLAQVRQALRKPLKEWNLEDVVAWTATLRLSNTITYQRLFAEHAIDGEVLWDMRSNDDWAPLGVVIFGDVRKLLKHCRRLRNAI